MSGEDFKKVRADIWLVSLGRRSGGEVWREGGGWAEGEIFREVRADISGRRKGRIFLLLGI